MVTLAPVQAVPGSEPTKMQEGARYGEPRQRTHWWLIITKRSRGPTTWTGSIVWISAHVLMWLEVSWFVIHPILWISSTTLRRTRDGAIINVKKIKKINNIKRWCWYSDSRNMWEACSHQRYVDFFFHSFSTVYQLLFAGYRREPAWEPRTVNVLKESELSPSRDNWRRRDKVEDHQPPITGLGSKLISLSILCQPFHHILFAGATMIPASPTMSISAEPIISTNTRTSACGQKRTISWLYRDHH